MARIFNEEEYNKKKKEILEFTLSLIFSKGYTNITIKDIIDGLQISKGALYHYFDSKKAIVDEIIEQTKRETEKILLPIANNSNLDALQKYRYFLNESIQWKKSNKMIINNIMVMWYSEENAYIRQRMTEETLKYTALLLEPIILQGIEENVFKTTFPEQVARICVGVSLSLMDSISELMTAQGKDQEAFEKFGLILDAYLDTIERILGAPCGSLKTFEKEKFIDWFIAT